ncbi:hypothetical protein JY651_50200 [Pyxidicoccus parkwayensis]|uniref:Uncharacterized protein n=1 Tax=Pyxidicoccus parkwayensis TaxID=2813578 RepID=A0ABX7NXR5_9BACT|nr:hypothetical protein [Pyxidicoccus parkwaysis]QSQ23169.1 hypothetical protein JY651_50200 [Pyxidicoccus parkwaysis]
MQSTALVVLVALLNREGDTESAQALLAACNATLGEGRCELQATTEVPEAVRAQVTWLEGELGADIQVLLGDPPLQRTLRFKKEDPRVERWRAVGLIIATLTEVRRTELVESQVLVEGRVEEVPVMPALPESPPAPPASGVIPSTPAPTVASTSWARWWELGAAASPALGGARGQAGAWVGLRQQLGALPVLGVFEAGWGAGLAEPDGVEVRALWVATGLGAFLSRGGWRPRVRAELVGERRSASIDEGGTGAHGSGFRAVVGGRVGAELLSPTWSRLGVLLGAEATVAARTDILVRGEPVAPVPAFRLGLRAGVFLGP